MKVYALPNGFANLDKEREALQEIGAELEVLSERDMSNVPERIKDASALFVQYTKVGADWIEQLDNCKIILRYGIGFDNVDLEAAGRHGIYVCNVPDYCLNEVADHTLAFLLSHARKIPDVNAYVHSGEWTFLSRGPIHCLHEMTLGLVGLGRIARKVAERARAFGMRLISFDPWVDPQIAADLGVELVTLDTLWAQSDYISLHAPLTEETRHLINDESLSKIKEGAVIINTSRGELVDVYAARRAIDSGRLGGVCLDVLEQEPPEPDHPLIGCSKAYLTPHAAYYSEPSLVRLQQYAAEEVARVLRGEAPRNPVNLKFYQAKG